MVPENIYKKAGSILKNKSYSEQDGDEIIISRKEDNIFYAHVKSQKRGSFGQMVISGDDLTFLYGSSAMDSNILLEKFKAGSRSTPHQNTTRRNVRLPVINNEKEMLKFANNLTDTFLNLFDKLDEDFEDPLSGYWHDMIYNGLVLLLSAKEKDTKLILLTMIYRSPTLVKTYLDKVHERDVYDYWIIKVPEFMKKEDAAELIHFFNLRIASLIGEQEIQNLCKNTD